MNKEHKARKPSWNLKKSGTNLSGTSFGRGQIPPLAIRRQLLGLIDEALSEGASLKACCTVVGLSENTVRNWRAQDGQEDRRTTIRKADPSNKITLKERDAIREVLYSSSFADRSPHKIVPALADQGSYLCSESTMYRILKEDGAAKRRTQHRKEDIPRIKPNLIATAPEQVFNWDITYLPSTIRGLYYRALLILDM